MCIVRWYNAYGVQRNCIHDRYRYTMVMWLTLVVTNRSYWYRSPRGRSSGRKRSQRERRSASPWLTRRKGKSHFLVVLPHHRKTNPRFLSCEHAAHTTVRNGGIVDLVRYISFTGGLVLFILLTYFFWVGREQAALSRHQTTHEQPPSSPPADTRPPPYFDIYIYIE